MYKTLLLTLLALIVTTNSAHATVNTPPPSQKLNEIIARYPVNSPLNTADANFVKSLSNNKKLASLGILNTVTSGRWVGTMNITKDYKDHLITIKGISTESLGLFKGSIDADINVNVQSTNPKIKVIVPKSITLNYSFTVFGVLGKDKIGKVADVKMTNTCAKSLTCSYRGRKYYDGVAIYTSSTLSATVNYPNNTYEVQAYAEVR